MKNDIIKDIFKTDRTVRDKSGDKKALKWIFNISKPQLPALIVIIVGDAIWAVFGTLTALFSKEIIDSAVGGNRDRMFWFIGIYLAVTLLLLGVHAIMRYLSEKCKANLDILFRNKMFSSLLCKSYPKISEHHTGDLVTRMTGDVGVITDAATSIIPQVVMMSVRLLFAMGVLIWMQWQFALVFTVGGILMFVFSRLFKGKVQKYHREMQQADGKTRSFWQEIFENLVVIKAFAAEDKSVKKSDTLMGEHYKLRMRRSLIGSLSMLGTASVIRIGHIFAIGYGAFMLFSGSMEYGTLTALTQLVGQVQQPFANMSGIMPKYYAALTSAQRLMEIESLENDSLEGERVNPKKMYDSLARLEINNVSFAYENDNPVLTDSSCYINKGDFVSIIGMSGIGKSTLFKILLDIYPKTKGEAVMVSTDGTKTNIDGLTRPMFAYVPQGNMLFSGTIKDNLLFLTDDNVDEKSIENALKCACANDFISSLPMGINSVIGENGVGLSEGQIQRISLARAILSNAPILLLDEATSALDEPTEATLLANLKSMTDKTCIIVTHRPKALQICNRHFAIEGKKIIEKNSAS